jgi:hypothetical protein
MRHSDGNCRAAQPALLKVALSEQDVRYLHALDNACTQFFHDAPSKVKMMATPMLFDKCGMSAGYQDLGSGKEMFVARLDDDVNTWPLSPPSFRGAVLAAMRSVLLPHGLAALSTLLRPLLQNAIASAVSQQCEGEQLPAALLEDLLQDMTKSATHTLWFKESVLFARHYIDATPCSGAEGVTTGPQAMPVGAHTDSGIITAMFVRRCATDLKALEFLSINQQTHERTWVGALHMMHEPVSGDALGDDMECVVCFFGEMVVPFAEFLLKRHLGDRPQLLDVLVHLVRSELSFAVGVHRVNPAVTQTPGTLDEVAGRCRHSYPFQLRADPGLLSDTGLLSSSGLTHRLLVL